MNILSPDAFWLLALAIPIILLYMLKLRRKQVQVSSTMLWVQVLRDQQANTPWQKLKRNLLLILQLLILTALVLAFARPAITTSSVASGSVIVLLDASASMNSTDVDPTRFDSARRAAQALVDGLSGDSTMSLILVTQTPQTLVSYETDKAVIKRALADVQPSQGSADWQAAFALATGAAQGNRDVTIVILSDGGLPENGLPSLPGEVSYVPVGASGDNLAITALALRPTNSGPVLFAEITNFSENAQEVLLSLYFGEELLSARQMELASGTSQSLTMNDLPNTAGVYRAQLTNPQLDTDLDALSLDNTAFAIYQPSSLRRVLLISNGNLYLEQLLTSLSGIHPYRALPGDDGSVQISDEPFDLYILDGLVPEKLPNSNLFFINPSSNPFFTVGEPFNKITNVTIQPNELTRYVDWSNVHVLQAKTVQVPDWADALITSEAGELVFAGETAGHRIASVNFDLRESDLPLQVAYPILFSNLLNYLVPPNAFDAVQALHPGESLTITPPLNVEEIVVASPSNMAYKFPVGAANLTFTNTDELGYYAVNFLGEDANTVEYFAVNLFDATESDIKPRETFQIGRTAITPADVEKVSQREIWPWLAGLALLVLMLEWQIFHRKKLYLRLPTRP